MSQSISGTRVLLVEDREDVRAVAITMLTRLGCSLVAVATAEAAIKELEHADASIDVVFTDIHLPGPMSGHDLAQLTSQRWPTIRIVLTSGSADRQENGGLARDARYPVVAKPYRAHHLLEALRQVLDRPAGG